MRLLFPKSLLLFAIIGTGSLSRGWAHEDLPDATASITTEIAAEPDDARLYLQRGELHRLRREWRLAASDYDHAEALDPELSMVRVARGRMLLESGHPGQALRVLDTTIDQLPVATRRIRARVLMELSRPAEAAADYLDAIHLAARPEPDFYLDCARAFRTAGDDVRALQVLDEAHAKLGPSIALESVALEIEVELSRFDDALERLDRLTAAAARKEGWLARRGAVLESMQRWKEARTAYQAALAALELVPPARRRTVATLDLETQIETALTRLAQTL